MYIYIISSEDYDDDYRERHRDRDREFNDWDRSDRGSRADRGEDFDFGDNDRNSRRNERQFKDEFRDDDEYTSVEQTQTTRTEKIVTNRRTRSVGKKLDLAGAASALGADSKVNNFGLQALLCDV